MRVLATVALLALPRVVSAQASPLDAVIARVSPQAVAARQSIHRNPELGNREFETAKLIAAHLRSLGMEVKTGVAHTGVVGILRGGRPGPVVAVRADMDALPVTEATDVPYKSTVKSTYNGQQVGVMHACGHDVHVGVQLGVASMLAGMKDTLPGTVIFIFQPAEEMAPLGEEGGAELMLKEGLFRDLKPAAVFGLHAAAGMPVGTLGYRYGATTAAADIFRITFKGKQAHGAFPHLGVDPIVMASEAVLAFQTIRSRNVPALEPSVLTVGVFRAGERSNIIPAEAYLEGTVRTYAPAVRDLIERRMKEISEGLATSNGGGVDFSYTRGYPSTLNDSTLARRSAPSLERAVGKDHVLRVEPSMAGEDFSFFANAVPGFFFSLGVQKAGTTSGGHHTPTFVADDAAIPVGIKAMTTLVLDYLNRVN